MAYVLNAWLERSQPFLQIIHRETGRVCVDFPAELLKELCLTGEICPADFCQTSVQTTKDVVRHLFYLAALKGCRRQGGESDMPHAA